MGGWGWWYRGRMAPRSLVPAVSFTALVLVSTLAAGCGGAPPAADPSSATGATGAPTSPPGATATSTASPSTGADAPAPGTSTSTSSMAEGAKTAPTAGTEGATAAKTDGAAPGPGIETAIKPKTTSAGGSYAVGTISADGISEADVIQVLNAAAGKTDACYVPLFKKQLGAKGVTNFEVVIDAKGKTKSVTLKENETKNADLVKCLDGIIKKLSWPTPLKAPAKTTVAWVVSGN
jgi:hypothetical protein